MRIATRKNNTTLLNAAFILWLISEIMFEHTIWSRLGLMMFVGFALLATHRLYWNYGLCWYAIFIAWSAVNLVTGHAVDNGLASEMTLTLMLNLLFLFAFTSYFWFVNDVYRILHLFKWSVFWFSVVCLIGGLSSVIEGKRLAIMGINENTIAMLAAYAVILFANDVMNKPGKKAVKEYAVIVILLITILMTGSRKGFIIPILGIYVLLCFRRPKKFMIYTLLIAVVGGVALYLLLHVPVLYDWIGYRVEPMLQFLQNEEHSDASIASRYSYIMLAWENAKKEPFWGYGLDCFRTMRYAYGTYSHCNYAEILYSLGWTGVIIYYLPYILVLVWAPKAVKRNRMTTALMMALFVPYAVCDYFNVTYFVRTSIIIPYMAMLTVGRQGRKHENETISG